MVCQDHSLVFHSSHHKNENGSYNGKVNLMNNEFHSILHSTPLEAEEEACRMALKFLNYFFDSCTVLGSSLNLPMNSSMNVPMSASMSTFNGSNTNTNEKKKYSCALNEFIQKHKLHPISFEFIRNKNLYQCRLNWESFTLDSESVYIKKQEAKEDVSKQLYEMLLMDPHHSYHLSRITLN